MNSYYQYSMQKFQNINFLKSNPQNIVLRDNGHIIFVGCLPIPVVTHMDPNVGICDSTLWLTYTQIFWNMDMRTWNNIYKIKNDLLDILPNWIFNMEVCQWNYHGGILVLKDSLHNTKRKKATFGSVTINFFRNQYVRWINHKTASLWLGYKDQKQWHMPWKHFIKTGNHFYNTLKVMENITAV